MSKFEKALFWLIHCIL